MSKFSEKLTFAAFKKKQATGKDYQDQAAEIGISKAGFTNLMKGHTVRPTRIVAKALVEYFEGEITMKDVGYE